MFWGWLGRTGHCDVPVWLICALPLISVVPPAAHPVSPYHGARLPGIHLHCCCSVASLPRFSQNRLAQTWPDSMASSPANIAAAWKICPVEVSWAPCPFPAVALLAGYKVTVVRVMWMCLWWHCHTLPIVSCREEKGCQKVMLHEEQIRSHFVFLHPQRMALNVTESWAKTVTQPTGNRSGWQLTHSPHADGAPSFLSFISGHLFIHFSEAVLQYHRAALGHKHTAVRHLELSLGAANRITTRRSTMTRWGSSWASGSLISQREGEEWSESWPWSSLKNGLLGLGRENSQANPGMIQWCKLSRAEFPLPNLFPSLWKSSHV